MLGLVFLDLPVLIVVVVAILCFAAPPLFAGPPFDRPSPCSLGFETVFPRSNDFVPLLPWFGVVLFGLAAARTYPDLLRGGHRLLRVEPPRARLVGAMEPGIYLLHQPVLFGLVSSPRRYPPGFLGFESTYQQRALPHARIGGRCRHLRAHLHRLLSARRRKGCGRISRQTLTAEGERRYFTLADECRAGAKAH